MKISIAALVVLLGAPSAASAAVATPQLLDLTMHWAGIACVLIFIGAYSLVIAEEAIHLRKSKPVMVAAGIIWLLVAVAYSAHGDTHTAGIAIRHNLLEFAELFLFLLAAMTYVNTMDERGIFDALRVWLVNQGFSLRAIFWVTGVMAFVLSPIADNLTTALLMATVIMAVAKNNQPFVVLGCINVVVAANAGRRLQSIWGYHHLDGVAKGAARVPSVLCLVFAGSSQLASARYDHESVHRQR